MGSLRISGESGFVARTAVGTVKHLGGGWQLSLVLCGILCTAARTRNEWLDYGSAFSSISGQTK